MSSKKLLGRIPVKYALCFLLVLYAAAPAFCGDSGERRFEIADKELRSEEHTLNRQIGRAHV